MKAAPNSWLLIKHRDDWAGDVDIAEFAPRSVKSDGDFEDILAAENPSIWHSNRPAKGGDTGKMFESIIERAAALKSGRESGTKVPAGRKTPVAGKTKPTSKRATASKKNTVAQEDNFAALGARRQNNRIAR